MRITRLFFSDKTINLVLRTLTIALKFVLSVLFIKELGIEDYGVFGLFQSTVIIMTFILGFDFYTFTSREILKENAQEMGFYLKHQIIFHIIAYILVLPFSYFLIQLDIIRPQYLYLFIIILVSEHLSQELYRILIVLKKPLVATIILFIRSGLWIILLYFLWEYDIDILDPNLKSVLVLWSIGAFLSVLIGVRHLQFKWQRGLNVSFIWQGIKIAAPFFLGTIFYKLIEFSGRYFLNFYFSEEEVGIFTFFSSIANVLFVFVQTVVIIVVYPLLVESKNNGYEGFSKVLKEFSRQIFKYTWLGLILALAGIYPLLLFLGKEVLVDNLSSYFILLFSTLFFCFSFIPHYALYTYKFDVEILKATFYGVLFNLAISFALVPFYGVFGASIAQLASFFVIYLGKSYYWKKRKKIL